MRVLITGFDPFGGEKVNPAYEAVKLLPDRIADAEIRKVEIPTSFSGSVKAVKREIDEFAPDIVINVGQAGGRAGITVEKVAINLKDAGIPDNDGEMPSDQPVQEKGADAYFSTLPVKRMVEHIKAHGIPCSVSYSAGTYVCNCIMYQMLYMAATEKRKMQAGFIHVPFSSEQAVLKGAAAPFMPVEMTARALLYAVEAAVNTMRETQGQNPQEQER